MSASDVHLHPVDDGMEVLAQESKLIDRALESAQPRRRVVSVQGVDVLTPGLQLLSAQLTRLTLLVGDVVDRTAE